MKKEEIDNRVRIMMEDKVVMLIISLIESQSGFSYDDLNVNLRDRPLVFNRQLTMYLIDKHTEYSLAIIGAMFNRDHATVIHSKKTIGNLTSTNKKIKSNVDTIDQTVIDYKNKNKVTRTKVFIELLSKYASSSEEEKEWFKKYLDSEQ